MPSTGSVGASFTTPTIMSGATSPVPRAMARMRPVRMPGAAAGRTTRRIVCHLVAPSASEACRMPAGTAASASSVATTTTGTVRRASVRAHQRMPPVPNVGVGSASAKKSWSMRAPIP